MSTDISSIVQNLLRVKEDHDRTVDQLTEKLEKSCRLCLCEDAKQISLFSNIEENIKYFQIANNFTNVAIEQNDKLPTRICEECSSKLVLFHKFKKKCEKSRSDLETLYNLLYKISPAEQTKRQEELTKKYEKQEEEQQQQDVEENYEIVEVLEDDAADDASHNMPIIDEEEYPFAEENNSYKVHLSEQGDLSFTQMPIEQPIKPKVNRRSFSAASTSPIRRDKYVTKMHNHTKIEEHITYVAIPELKKENTRKSYSQKILLQNDERAADDVVITSPPTVQQEVTPRKLWNKKTKTSSTNELIQDLTEISEGADLLTQLTPNKKIAGNVGERPSTKKRKIVVKRPIKHEVGVVKKHKHHCDLCGASYKLKTDFKQHILESHGVVEKIDCSLCGNTFARESHLKLHMRIHNNQRPYPCDVCDKRFIKSSDLSRHKKIHSDNKDYSCGVCEKAFKRLGDVKSHMRTHTGERPYVCTFCNQPFSSHTSMKKHVIKHHGTTTESEKVDLPAI